LTTYVLPPALRPLLAEPFGPIHDSGEAARKVQGRLVIAVGDVVTQTFLDAGIVPKLMVVDGVTQRGAVVENALQGLPDHGVKRVEVANPAGAITHALLSAMDGGLKGKGSTLVVVKGEEDLAALPAMIMAPPQAAVCYGQPPSRVFVSRKHYHSATRDRDLTPSERGGVVIVIVTPEVRKRAQDILDQMEVK